MMPTQYAWATAAIGSITIFWNYLRNLFMRISSFVVVTADIEGGIAAEAMMTYLWKNFRRTPFSPRRFTADKDYIRPRNRWGIVGYETTSKGLTFYKGWKPLFVTGGQNKQDESFNGNLKISFLRGLFNLDHLIEDSIEQLDSSTHNKIKKNRSDGRYYVRKVFGKNGRYRDNDNSPKSEEGLEASKSMTAGGKSGNVPIKWKREDLGAPVSESPFKNLAYPSHVHDFITEIKRWKESQEWYNKRGIPWRFGAGLFGPPGTGKTSFVRAIAQELDMPIHIYDLTTMNNEELSNFWRASLNTAPCVVLFEDIDRLFDKDKNIKQSKGGQPLTLDALLNCISGVEPSDGILVLVTANHPDRLDPALGVPDATGKSTRPGRLDSSVFFGELTREGRVLIAQRILSDCAHLIEATVNDGDHESGAQFERRCQRIALAELWGKPKVFFEGPTATM